MPFLIDGNNLIGHIPHLNLRDPNSRMRLIFQLLQFQKVKNTRVIVVFDGHPDKNLPEEKFKDIPFFVRYPDFDENADQVIKTIISQQTDLRQFFVVSSDREIKRFAQSQGAKAVGCDYFHKELKSALREHKKMAEMEKDDTTPSPLEIQQWTDIFKGKK